MKSFEFTARQPRLVIYISRDRFHSLDRARRFFKISDNEPLYRFPNEKKNNDGVKQLILFI